MPIMFHLESATEIRTRENVVNLFGDVDEFFRRCAERMGLDASPLMEIDAYDLNRLSNAHRERFHAFLKALRQGLTDIWRQTDVDPEVEAPAAMGLDEGYTEEQFPCGRDGILTLLDGLIELCQRAAAEHDTVVARGD